MVSDCGNCARRVRRSAEKDGKRAGHCPRQGAGPARAAERRPRTNGSDTGCRSLWPNESGHDFFLEGSTA